MGAARKHTRMRMRKASADVTLPMSIVRAFTHTTHVGQTVGGRKQRDAPGRSPAPTGSSTPSASTSGTEHQGPRISGLRNLFPGNNVMIITFLGVSVRVSHPASCDLGKP